MLHVCCAPCTSGVFDQLSPYFNITLIYANDNIYPKDEFNKRFNEFNKLKQHYNFNIISLPYNHNDFLEKTKGYENYKEGDKRCEICFKDRLEKTVKVAKELEFEFFTTTLSVSPYKNAEILNSIGEELEKKYNIKYIYSDFKKKEGYKNSIKNSKEFGLYRQNYCGCEYSLRDMKYKQEN
ncbi:epoxyqueuosine reductase QueH [bacterium]|nr:epoxyqueuosine reductase QueH [bacterium]